MHAAALVQPSMKSFRAALIGCMASQWLLISNNTQPKIPLFQSMHRIGDQKKDWARKFLS
jgi:hypothetical protein